MASGDSSFGYVVPKSMFSIAANASRLVATIVAEDLHSDDAVAGQSLRLSPNPTHVATVWTMNLDSLPTGTPEGLGYIQHRASGRFLQVSSGARRKRKEPGMPPEHCSHPPTRPWVGDMPADASDAIWGLARIREGPSIWPLLTIQHFSSNTFLHAQSTVAGQVLTMNSCPWSEQCAWRLLEPQIWSESAVPLCVIAGS